MSCAAPSGEGVQMSETDCTCWPVCLSECVTDCQGSVLAQGPRCPQGYVLALCVREKQRLQ